MFNQNSSSDSESSSEIEEALEEPAAEQIAQQQEEDVPLPADAPPPPAAAAAPPETPPLVTEAEGFTLELSGDSSTGYKGVSFKNSDRKFMARLPGVGGKTLGYYPTALAAAVMRARAMATGSGTTSEKKDANPSPYYQAGPAERSRRPTEQLPVHDWRPLKKSKKAPSDLALVTEAEGFTLELSSTSTTGYKGVYTNPSGTSYRAIGEGEHREYLGSFATTLDAAVARARAMAPPGAGAGSTAQRPPAAPSITHDYSQAIQASRSPGGYASPPPLLAAAGSSSCFTAAAATGMEKVRHELQRMRLEAYAATFEDQG
jgi:predicted secreted protein